MQGAKNVVAFEILPQPANERPEDNPWPQWPRIYRIDYGHEEANLKWNKDPRIYGISSKEFIADENGHVSAITTVRVKWEKNEKGAWVMSEIPFTEETFKVRDSADNFVLITKHSFCAHLRPTWSSSPWASSALSRASSTS